MSYTPVKTIEFVETAPWFQTAQVPFTTQHYNGRGNPKPTQQAIHMSHAFLWTERVTCIRADAGCVITEVIGGKEMCVSHGYNGGGVGMNDNDCAHEGKVPGACEHFHSESNALVMAGRSGNRNLYVTFEPCLMCAKAIVNAGGFQRVYVGGRGYRTHLGIQYLLDAGIQVYWLIPPPGWMGGMCESKGPKE